MKVVCAWELKRTFPPLFSSFLRGRCKPVEQPSRRPVEQRKEGCGYPRVSDHVPFSAVSHVEQGGSVRKARVKTLMSDSKPTRMKELIKAMYSGL